MLTDVGLLSISAILRWFDHNLLAKLASREKDEIELFLASDVVVPWPDLDNAYGLREDVRQKAVALLRAEHPRDELILRTRVFEYFLEQMERADTADQRRRSEDDLFYQLGDIFLLLAARGEWHTIAHNVTLARKADPTQLQHLQRLSFYEGYVAIRTAEYDRGEAILQTLIEQPDLESDLQVQILNGLGHVHYYQNRYDRALSFYQQVFDLVGITGDRFYQAIALANIGQIYNEISAYDKALDIMTQSLDIFRELGDSYREAQILFDIGNNALKLGRWNVAQHHFQEAAKIHGKLQSPTGLAYAYWGQGFLHHMLGNDVESETAYVDALTILQSSTHSQPALGLDLYSQLGFLYQTQGRLDEALIAYEHAIDFAIQLGNHNWKNLIDYRRGNVFERQGRLDEAYAAYSQAIASIEALGGATESEDIKISLFGTTQQIYEAMVLLCLELGRPAEAFHYVERARSRAFLDSLAKKSPELSAALDHPVVTIADLQAQLPEGAVLLEYYTTGVLPLGENMINKLPPENTRLREHLTQPPNIILFAITRDRFDVYRPALNPNSLRPPIGDHYPGRHLLHGRLPQHLYDRLIGPAAELLDGCSVLYLVPHGPLHYVPFTALRSAADQYLLHAGGPALAHAPSATILLRNCLGRLRERGSALLALGFNDTQGEQPLRYAEAEARHIARMIGGDAWTGTEPKSDRLITAGHDIRWLHIAGHARFDPYDPLGSALHLGLGDTLSARAIIRDLDLAADLVTLSSCTSGVSHVVPGDELLGLQRALLYAGVPTVVCTRWEARDLVALLIMDHFYTALLQGQSPAQALRDAQIAVRDLTSRDLAALLDRWRAEATDLAAALGAPADALQDVEASTRELGDIDVHAILSSWRAEAADLAAALEQPATVPPNMPEARPFADPLLWAPFMLVGRA